MLDIHTPLTSVKNFSRFLPKLKKLNLETVRDLLWHFPVRYEDFSQIYKIEDLIPNQEATVHGQIIKIESRHAWRRRLFLVEAVIEDETGSIRAVWFNQPYIKNTLRLGTEANFSGKISVSNGELQFSNPTYEVLRSREIETKHTGRIVPVYSETKGLTSKGLRFMIKAVLDALRELEEPFPPEVLAKEELPDIHAALTAIHFPENLEDAFQAKRRFAFEDLFFLQLHNLYEKLKLREEKSISLKIAVEEIKQIVNTLPFTLMQSQKQSLWEVVKDLRKPHPMNRLLQGDVGSGKTIVAGITALLVAQKKFQAAFMAPTEILARQHYETLTTFFKHTEHGIALLTGSEARVYYGEGLHTVNKKEKVVQEIEKGNIGIAVGTHALIQKNIAFPRLALVIVDEQHRFGVTQRAELLKKNKMKVVPHLLSMSATPIPRTLSLTLFGDLDLSLITELPKNRKSIVTKTIPPNERNTAYAFIKKEIQKGRQVFVICPRIERNENNEERIMNSANVWNEVKTVKEEYEKISKKIFPEFTIDMLHGKLKAKEKERIMREFNENKINLIVSTSVVEVGVNIPNATIMMIESADRFGLAQLYQFRGRVGRGEHQSYCLLFTESDSKATQARLKSVVEAKNGFELAEKDLRLRGPGEFLGQNQTGMPDLAMKAVQNPDLVKKARETALEIIQKDKTLKKYPLLYKQLFQFEKEVHWE